ncbi:MAG: sulfotransferase, partial [Anaerolineales bacterium]
GTEVFNRVLHAIGRDRPALPQILVSTQDFLVRYEEQANVLTADTGLEEPPSQPEPLETRQPTGVAADESHPAPERPGITSEYVPPRNEIEQVIADVWQKLFGIEHIGVLDDFFQLGGHSLPATQILNKLRKDYQNADLSLRNLFEQPNIAGLATIIQQAYKAEEAKPIKARFSEGGPSERRHLVAEYLRAKIAHALNVDSRQITGTFSEGQIKEMTPALIWDLKRDFDLRIYPQELSKRPSLSRLLDFTVNELEKQAGVGTFESLSRPTPRDVQPSQLQAGALQETPPTQKNPSMVFLLSAPRSGSTLLRLMLAGHSSLFCPPELALLAFDSLAAWRENQQAFFAQNGVEHALMALMNLNIKGAGNHIEDLIRKNTPIREVYRLLQTKAGSRTLVDKTPGYAMNKQILMRAEAWFEQPKYVYLVRHPYTVIDSCVRNRIHVVLGEEDADPHLFAEEVWTGWNRNILEFLGTVPEERSHRVYYEELVKEPDESEDSSTVMRDLCEFLSIPFEDAVLNPYVGKRMIAGPGDPDIFQHDRINPELGEVWKKIRLPRTLLESTINLASEFNYELPQETSESTLADSQDLIANLAQLSDEEVDALLRKIMTEG